MLHWFDLIINASVIILRRKGKKAAGLDWFWAQSWWATLCPRSIGCLRLSSESVVQYLYLCVHLQLASAKRGRERERKKKRTRKNGGGDESCNFSIRSRSGEKITFGMWWTHVCRLRDDESIVYLRERREQFSYVCRSETVNTTKAPLRRTTVRGVFWAALALALSLSLSACLCEFDQKRCILIESVSVTNSSDATRHQIGHLLSSDKVSRHLEKSSSLVLHEVVIITE